MRVSFQCFSTNEDKIYPDHVSNFLLNSGVSATCPLNDTQFFKPIDTPCNHHTQLCDRGVREFHFNLTLNFVDFSRNVTKVFVH